MFVSYNFLPDFLLFHSIRFYFDQLLIRDFLTIDSGPAFLFQIWC